MSAGPPDGEPVHAEIFDDAEAPPTTAKSAKSRKKRAPQPTYDDGAATRVFKFPSRTYPKSTYYVTNTEIIIRIKKARKKWKLVLPKKRVASYRTNRWFAKPRWVEVELTYTQALKHGLVEAREAPAEPDTATPGAPVLDASIPAASMLAGNDPIVEPEACAQADIASPEIAPEEPAHECEAAEDIASTVEHDVEAAPIVLSVFSASVPYADVVPGVGALADAVANAAAALPAAVEPPNDVPAAETPREETRIGPAPPPSFARSIPVVDRSTSSAGDVGRRQRLRPMPAASHPRPALPERRNRTVWLGASALAMVLLTCSAVWWRVADQASLDQASLEATNRRGVSAIVTAGIDVAGTSQGTAADSPVATARQAQQAAQTAAANATTALPIEEREEAEARAKLDAEAAAMRLKEEEALRRTAEAEAEASRLPSQIGPSRIAAAQIEPAQNEPAVPPHEQPLPAQATIGSAGPAAIDQCRDVAASAVSSVSIQFAFASASLGQPSVDALTRLAASLRSCPAVRMTIEGHTDSDGHVYRNRTLSVRRAEAVRKLLIKAGTGPDQLSVIGFGQIRPLVPNDSSTNKRRNRRIEFVVE